MTPPTSDRMHALRRFVADALADPTIAVEPASADASFRSYWRVTCRAGTRIVMDAPPAQEDIRPWLSIAGRLRGAGLHAPAVFAADEAGGFVLMEDLGTRTYLPELDAHTVDALYADALAALIRMQTGVDTRDLPRFDEVFLVAEMELMPEWFLKRHLDYVPGCDEWDVIEAAFRTLTNSALAQPRAFMHRDYHSRNLLVIADDNPGIIDFQGAMLGPVTYDLASLLRDCYIAWEPARVDAWVEDHRGRLRHADLIAPDVDHVRFRRWFDLIGLQRHIKVLGIFCRLCYRDGKPGYLADLPRVWHYVVAVASHYPELADFLRLIEFCVGGRDLARPHSEGLRKATGGGIR